MVVMLMLHVKVIVQLMMVVMMLWVTRGGASPLVSIVTSWVHVVVVDVVVLYTSK